MKEQDLLFGVLSKTLQKSPEDIKRMVYEGDQVSETAIELLLKEDAERIKRIQKEFEIKGFDNGFSKAKGETLSEFENRLKAKFGVDTTSQGIDLVEELLIKAQKSNLNADDVKKHPAFLELERSTVRKDEYNKLMNEYETYKNNISRNEKMKRIHAKALEHFEKLNPVIEEDPIVAKTRKEKFLKEFDAFDYEVDGEYIMPVKNGTRISDEYGNPLGFESLVRDIASKNFVLSQQTYRSNAGNKSGQTIIINVPKTDDEYRKALLRETDPEKKIAIKKAYYASKGN